MQLTVQQLRQYTKAHRDKLFQNATRVSISFGKVEEGQDARGYYRKVPGRGLSQGKGKRQKTFEFRFYYPKARAKEDQYIPIKLRKGPYVGPVKSPDLTVNDKVWVRCNCEYFMYHCEVADAETDNSTIEFSNGKFPVITNPQGIPHLCKHLLSALGKGALLKK